MSGHGVFYGQGFVGIKVPGHDGRLHGGREQEFIGDDECI